MERISQISALLSLHLTSMSHPWVHMFASSSCTGIGSSSFFSAGELSCQSVSAITKLSTCRTSACFVECSFNHRLKRLSLIRIGRARLQICCTGSPADPYAQCSMSPTLKTRKPGSTCVMGLQARVWVNYLYVETLNLNRHCVRDFGNLIRVWGHCPTMSVLITVFACQGCSERVMPRAWVETDEGRTKLGLASFA